MFKFYAGVSLKVIPSAWLLGVGVFGVVFSYFVLPFSSWFGFLIGILIFCSVFLSLESLSRAALALGSVRGGVGGALFWLGFKFLAPISLIYYANTRHLSVWFIFFGLIYGLLSATFILWRVSLINEKNH